MRRALPLLFALPLTLLLAGCGSTMFDLIDPNTRGICAIVIFILDVVALIQILQSTISTSRKVLWGLIIFFLPVVGLLLYYFLLKKELDAMRRD